MQQPNDAIYYECVSSINRARRAWNYVMGTLDEDDAQTMLYDLQVPAGSYPLLTLSVRDVMDEAQGNAEAEIEGRWLPHSELAALVEEACQHVSEHYEPLGDQYFEARMWALDKIEEFAKANGIDLVPTPEYAEMMQM